MKKIIVLMVCLLLASPAFARDDHHRGGHHQGWYYSKPYYYDYGWTALGTGLVIGALAAQQQPQVVYVQKPSYLPVYDKNGNITGYVQQ